MFEHLTAFVINLDRSPERWSRFTTDHAGVFERIVRIPAIDGREASVQSVRSFADAVNETVWRVCYERGLALNTYGRGASDGLRKMFPSSKVNEGSFAFKHMAGCMGMWQSHQLALQTAIVETPGSFMIIEDDAALRTDVKLVRPIDAHAILWGSVTMGSVVGDTRRYDSGQDFHLQRPKARFNALLTTATEYTHFAGEHMLQTLRVTPGQIDAVWWESLHLHRVYKCVPAAFTQDLSDSTRRSDVCNKCGAPRYSRHRTPCRN